MKNMTNEKSRSPVPSQPMKRRDALGKIAFALGAAWTVISGAVALVYAATPLRKTSLGQSVSIGKLNQFNDSFRRVQIETTAGSGWHTTSERSTVFVRMISENEPLVFSGTCTHLGCTVRWENESGEFLCPCHGGSYTADGEVSGGPPNAPLHRLAATVKDNEIVVEIGGTPT